jgi:murein DD-endopeptidase MepM/ murein hydrolase activator NlpD
MAGAQLLALAWLENACVRGGTAVRSGEDLRGHPEPDLVGARHVVAPGETLFRIAKAYGVSPEALAAANGIADPKALEVGLELTIPEPESPAPEAAPLLEGPKSRSPPPMRGKGPSRDPSLRGDLTWPLRGVLYARFGRKGREPHDGIDLAAPLGTPVRTAAAGTVIYAGEQRGYGLIAIIEHPNGLTTIYAHNRDLRVRAGQHIREGEVIATVGESGRTTGPHLHFEVRCEGVPVDPLDHLGAIPQ